MKRTEKVKEKVRRRDLEVVGGCSEVEVGCQSESL